LQRAKNHPILGGIIFLAIVIGGTTQFIGGVSQSIDHIRRLLPHGVRPTEITGIWRHDIYGDLQLEEEADRVRGTYAYPRQVGFIYGELRGEIKGRRLDVTSCQDTRRDVPCENRKWQGEGYLILSPDGNKLEGKWRYKNEHEWHADWSFERR
jgi:hypothetical protein